jgi:hypothetical protein
VYASLRNLDQLRLSILYILAFVKLIDIKMRQVCVFSAVKKSKPEATASLVDLATNHPRACTFRDKGCSLRLYSRVTQGQAKPHLYQYSTDEHLKLAMVQKRRAAALRFSGLRYRIAGPTFFVTQQPGHPPL